MILINKNKIITNFFMFVAITALIGGFLLGIFKKNEDTNNLSETNESVQDNENEENNNIIDYTNSGTPSNNSSNRNQSSETNIQDNNHEEQRELDENGDIVLTDEEQKALEEARKIAKESKEHAHIHGDYESAPNFLNVYKQEYGDEVINDTVVLAYDIIFMMQSNNTSTANWESFSSNKMLQKIVEMNRQNVFFDFEIHNIELLPVEREFDGIVIGVLLETLQNVTFYSFDFIVEDDQPILDDINIVWGY